MPKHLLILPLLVLILFLALAFFLKSDDNSQSIQINPTTVFFVQDDDIVRMSSEVDEETCRSFLNKNLFPGESISILSNNKCFIKKEVPFRFFREKFQLQAYKDQKGNIGMKIVPR